MQSKNKNQIGITALYGEQQFTLAVEGVNVLLFKVDLDAFLFEFADGDEAIHGVSSESADGLCNDEVDFSRQGILDHLIETRTVLGIRAGNPLICIYNTKLNLLG